MKRTGTALVIVFLLAAIVLSFFAGDYMRSKAYKDDRAQRCGRYLSFAIDTLEDKGLFLDGTMEFIASNIWVAHELCDNPEISAELSSLWNTLVYEEDAFAGQEEVLADQLKDILERYP